MESQVEAGRTKAIGLSNFNSHQIERIVQTSRIKPANLQVEMHAYFQQKRLRAYCKKTRHRHLRIWATRIQRQSGF